MSELLLEGATATPVSTESSGVFRRIVRNPFGLGALIWLMMIVVVALAAGQLAPHSPKEVDLEQLAAGPSWNHLLGTDHLGRDVLSRLMFGAEPSLEGVVVAVISFALIGLPLGLVAGYRGGWFDAVVGRFAEVLQSLPGFILLLVVLTVFGKSQNAAMVTLGLLGSPGLIRVTRAVTLSVREELFIAAARVFGLTDLAIVARHVWPRIRSTVIVNVALFAGIALLVQTGLAFLGFGPQPPNPSWGGMIGDASILIASQPLQILPPGLVVGLTVIALGLLGNAVRDAVSESWSHSQAVLLRRRKARQSAGAVAVEPSSEALVQVRDLTVSVVVRGQRCPVVRSVSLDIARGETVGVVGESGCGKTLTALGVIGVLPPGAQLDRGAVYLAGQDVAAMSSEELDGVRGKRIGYVSQDPALALAPVFTVGHQIAEAVRRHHAVSRGEAQARVVELLSMVRLREPKVVARRYPHQLSGGMAQRVCIALALAGRPELLVADEPTTALDVTTQAEILALLVELKDKTGMATLLVTHDWGVVAELCDRAVVMYAGQIVESGPVTELFERPRHPYTAALLRSNPHVVLERRELDTRLNGTGIKPLPSIPGEVPSPASWGRGCAFAPRCPYATPACRADAVPLLSVGRSHDTRCIHSERVSPLEMVATT